MKNPYADIVSEDEVRIGRTGLRIGIVVFWLMILVPSLSLLDPSMRQRGAQEAAVAPAGLRDWLVFLEKKAKSLPLLEAWRKVDQARMSRFLNEGNQRVFAGDGGWLYYRADLEAVYGKGPYYREPLSVARERFDQKWQSPVPVVKAFAAELAKREIRLILVPVPTKPMICREGLGLPDGGTALLELAKVTADLAGDGIEVVDLFPLIKAQGPDKARFLKQDTHWTPGVMESVAREVARRVNTAGTDAPLKTRLEAIERENTGDLAGMLDLGKDQKLFPPERVSLHRVLNFETGALLPSDPNSEVVVLGDSFVNIYEDPSLGFGKENETSIGAGFSSHFAASIGRTVHTIAINGGGATGVREAFAGLPADQLKGKKTVIWLLSSRDLLLAEIPARRAGIEWRSVTFNEETPASPGEKAGVIEVTATLRERSTIEDPAQTPYASAIYSTVFSDIGGADASAIQGEEIYVFLWAFRGRKLEKSAGLEPGLRYRLRLAPISANADANRAARLDDLFRPDLAPFFAAEVEKVE